MARGVPGSGSWGTAVAVALLLATLPAGAQSPDEFAVAIRFDHGRFVTDRTTATLALSDRYRSLLRAGVTDPQLIAEFCDALDREFRLMPGPYYFALTNDEKARDIRGELKGSEFDTLRAWNQRIREFPQDRLRVFLEDRAADFDVRLKQVSQRSALAEWLNEIDHTLDSPFQFRVRDPLVVGSLDTPQLGTVLDRNRVLDMLAPLDGLPANPERVQDILLDFFVPRGMTPKVDVQLDATPPAVIIVDTSRIARLLLPADLRDVADAAQIAYNTLPHRLFKAFPLDASAMLPGTLASGADKREIDLRALAAAFEAGRPAVPFELPPVDATVLSEAQQRLLQLGFTASLYENDPANRLMDLVIEAVTPQPGAATDSNAATATAATPPSAPGVSSRPNAAPNVQPDPLIPSPTMPKRPRTTPRRDQKNFIGGGVEYRPEQGVRLLGSFQRRNTVGLDLTRITAGGMGEGFASGSYSRDYLFFGSLGRRLSVNVTGGSNFDRQRVLDNVLTDERRTGGAAGLTLEALRDGPGHQLDLRLDGRRETVSLAPAGSANATREATDATVTTVALGAAYHWRRSLTLHPIRVRIEPTFRIGLPLGRELGFGHLRVGAQYHQSIAGPLEAESRFSLQRATARTPIFEQPSFGGMESVRGFRTDERVGRRFWSWQNELWLPVVGSGKRSAFTDFLRRNVRIAGLYDVGSAGATPPDPAASSGFRHAAGVGLRVRYQGVVIESDWAYGFASDDGRRPGRGRFHFNFRLP